MTAAEKLEGILIRPGVTGDRALIVRSWTETMADTASESGDRRLDSETCGRKSLHARIVAHAVDPRPPEGDRWLSDYKYPFRVFHSAFANLALERGRSLVAAWADDANEIGGWVAWGPRGVHYVYVRRKMRRMGLGRALLEAALESGCPRAYWVRTPDGEAVAKVMEMAFDARAGVL